MHSSSGWNSARKGLFEKPTKENNFGKLAKKTATFLPKENKMNLNYFLF